MDDGINDGGGDLNVMMIALPETNKLHLKMDVLEDDRFLLGFRPFSGAFAVSFREGSIVSTRIVAYLIMTKL